MLNIINYFNNIQLINYEIRKVYYCARKRTLWFYNAFDNSDKQIFQKVLDEFFDGEFNKKTILDINKPN